MLGPQAEGDDGRLRRQWRAVVMAAMAWTAVVAASLAWNVYNTWGNARELATREARTHFNKDQVFRKWAADHGGLYVEVDGRTPPNPNLEHIPERDVITPSGRHLTLMNSSYVVRQIMADYGALYGVRGRLTSLRPINPLNAPDAWEVEALKRFEAGEQEVQEVSELNGEPSLRLMTVIIAEKPCLKCHAEQGYQEGDVRGGMGVALPLAPYLDVARNGILIQSGSHAAIWAVGLVGIGLVGRRFRAYAREEMADQARVTLLHHKMDLVLQAVNEGIIGIDRQGIIGFVNPAGAAMLGYEVEELRDRPLHDTIHSARADGHPCEAADCPTSAAMRDKCCYQLMGELFRRKDGSTVPVEMVTSPVLDHDAVVGAVVVFRDVSERMEADARTSDLLARLARSNQDLQQFAYTVSHDLQEPLRMVHSYVQLLGRRLAPVLDSDAREYMGFAVDGAARMSHMIADLVEYSRVETRGGLLQAVDAGRVVEDALANLAMAVEEAGASVTVDGPMPRVVGDFNQLVRLFQNLIGNAVKFRAPDRPPVIRVSAHSADGMAEFRVADNGIGIPEDSFGRIFQIFQRLHGRDRYDGTGIGLAIVRRTAERHGGKVWLDSAVGAGSVFHVTLPLAEDSAEPSA